MVIAITIALVIVIIPVETQVGVDEQTGKPKQPFTLVFHPGRKDWEDTDSRYGNADGARTGCFPACS